MASDVDRQSVFRTTKVRTALRKDGSWIRRSAEKPTDPEPCKSPVLVDLVNVSSVESSPIATSNSSSPKSPAPKSPTPQSPAPQSPTPQSPAPLSPAPLSPTPQSPASGQGTPTSPGWRGRRGGSYVLSALRKFE
ncbi:hypothetical protein PDJAM_G00259330 [Pangasius djambal]|nr:hypothetical protein [Pangasius djambal]